MAIFQSVTSDKNQYLPLLRLADSCRAKLDQCIEAGEMYILSVGEAPICVAVVQPISETICELRNIVTDPAFRGLGYATRMLTSLLRLYASRFRTMYAEGTPSIASFYARLGFTPDAAPVSDAPEAILHLSRNLR